MQKLTVLLIIVLIANPSIVWGAGFSVFEAGARSLGMGGALTARADDPSALFFNPAGITQLEDTQVYLGASLIFAGTDFKGEDPSPGVGMNGTTGTMTFTPVNLHVTHSFRDDLVAGIGMFNNFGLGQDYENPATFPGRHITYKVQLKTWNINPALAWAPHEKLSVAAGLQIVYADVDINRILVSSPPLPAGINVAGANINGDDVGIGFNAGAQYRLNEDFVFGASFRSSVEVTPSGDATFEQFLTGNSAIDNAVAANLPGNQAVEATVKLPWFLSVAGAWHGLDRWAFEVDVNVFGWSTFEDLTFRFAEVPDEVRVQDYENVVSVRTGAEFALNEQIALRGGYYFDPTPQPRKAMSPFLGDVDRHGLSFGGGYDAGKWWADAFALFLLTSERSTNGESLDGYDGIYDPFANIIGANVGVRF